MSILLTLKNLTLSHPHKKLFNDVTFSLHEGDRIGILGLNGHGKSSLFKIIMELQSADTTVPPFTYDKNRDLSLFYVPQELPNPEDLNIEEYFYEFYPEFKAVKQEIDRTGNHELYEKLSDLGEDRIFNSFSSYLKSFGVSDLSIKVKGMSGGEQRKLALALGLSCPQQVVLWDEPTNHLDLETIKRFEDELQNTRKTFMMISHDRSLLNNVVDRIVHIQSGKLESFQGSYADYLVHLQNEEQKRAKELDRLQNQNRRETAWIRRGVQARRTKSKKRIADYSTLQTQITDLKNLAAKTVSLNLKGSGRKSKVLVEAENLQIGYGDKTLIRDLSFTLAKGDKIALMGANGTGKSTLIKVLLEELAPKSGRLKRLDGLDTGYFSQKRENLPENITPWQLVGEGIDFVMSNTGEKKHVASYLDGFLFRPEEIKRPIHTFSGGEKNRLQLAQFMKHARDLWIFDEPTNDLDLETIGILEEELRNYQGALIIVAHDRTFIENVTDKCWLIHDNKVEFFEAGWPQAELYLEAYELEDELKKMQPPPIASSSTSGLSNKDRDRLEKIEPEIEKIEALIADFEKAIASIDYSKPDATTKLETLNSTLGPLREKLEGLMEEWAALEAKSH